jgi:hypothetical protein
MIDHSDLLSWALTFAEIARYFVVFDYAGLFRAQGRDFGQKRGKETIQIASTLKKVVSKFFGGSFHGTSCQFHGVPGKNAI